MGQIRLRALAHERPCGCGKGCSERLGLDRARVGTLESSEGLGGKVVVPSGLHRG
jgi:hypothetical protein